MGFWNRDEEKQDHAEAGGDPSPDEARSEATGDEALRDMIASLLRLQGEHWLGSDEEDGPSAPERFEAWARHVLVGTAPPDRADYEAEADERDWHGLRAFCVERRRTEAESVLRSLEDLRDTVWVFVQGLGRMIPADRAREEQLVRLRELAASDDTDSIKRAVRSSVDSIERVLGERHDQSEALVADLSEQLREISEQLTEAREQASTDALSGLYNRAALDDRLQRLSELAAITGRAATVYMIDLDHFKWINDRFGHAAGDEVLRSVAACLRRAFDGRGHFVARYGGDEFCAVVESADRGEDARLGEKVVQAARDLDIEQADEPIRVGLSIGAARLEPGQDVAVWLENADRALYAAKEGGRDRFELAE